MSFNSCVMTRQRRGPSAISPYEIAKRCVQDGADLPKEGRFEVRFINSFKGKGVFAAKPYKKGDYLLWYWGERLSEKEASQKENEYDTTGDGCYVFFFKERGKPMAIDATRTETVAKFVNDDHIKPNSNMKRVVDQSGTSHLCLFALRDISVNEEILYNYGEGLDLPWRKVKKYRCNFCNKEFTDEEGKLSCEEWHLQGYQVTPCGPYPIRGGRWSEKLSLLRLPSSLKVVNTIRFSKASLIASGRGKVFVGLYKTQHAVAIKRIESDFVQCDELEIFKLLSDKTIPLENVLPQIDVEKDEDFTYLVTPLCEGNLRELMEKKILSDLPITDLTPSRCLTLCKEFLIGLNELHKIGIIHRDIKPDNLLIDISGKLNIGDFGISKHLNFGKTTLTTSIAGTCAWMASETCLSFLAGCNFQYKQSTDIQVAGCVLYYIMSRGHHPFESTYPFSDDLNGLRENIIKGCYNLEQVCPEMKVLIDKMLHVDPRRRPHSGECLEIFLKIQPLYDQKAIEDTNDVGPETISPTSHADTVRVDDSNNNFKEDFDIQKDVLVCSNDLKHHPDSNLTDPATSSCSKDCAHMLLDVGPETMSPTSHAKTVCVDDSKNSFKEDFDIQKDVLVCSNDLKHHPDSNLTDPATSSCSKDCAHLLPDVGPETMSPTSHAKAVCVDDSKNSFKEDFDMQKDVLVCSNDIKHHPDSNLTDPATSSCSKDCTHLLPDVGPETMSPTSHADKVCVDDSNNSFKDVVCSNDIKHHPDSTLTDPATSSCSKDCTHLLPDVECLNTESQEEKAIDILNHMTMMDAYPSGYDTLCEQDSLNNDYTDDAYGTVTVFNYCSSDGDQDNDDINDPDYCPPKSDEMVSDSTSENELTTPAFVRVVEGICSKLDGDPGNGQSKPDHMTDDSSKSKRCKDELPTFKSRRNAGSSKKIAINNTIPVRVAKPKRQGKRIWDRKHFCVYCKREMAHIYRHLICRHAKEIEVAQALSFPSDSIERKRRFSKIKNKGNFQHNYEVTKTGKGEVVPFKRPSHNYKQYSTEYLPCKACFAFYSKKVIGKHWKNCHFAKDSTLKMEGRRFQKAASYMLPSADSTSKLVKENVLPAMRQDAVTLAARNDSLIMDFASRTYQQYAHLKKNKTFTSERIRTLGRLLIMMRQIDDGISQLGDCIHPAKFNTVVQAVQSMAGYDEEAATFSTPSLGLKVGYYLKDCAHIILSQAIQSESKSDEDRATRFLDLYRLEWQNKVSSYAGHTLQARKANSPKLLPVTEDIVKLTNRLQDIMQITSKNLKDKTSIEESWSPLCKATLAQVILFNRRREGEVSRMLLSTYVENKDKPVGEDDDVNQCLSPLERRLLNQFTRIEIPGKRGRNVPILLTPELKECINLLCSTRSEAGVSHKNPYLFARQYASLECHRGSQCLRLYAKSSGARHPERLTSTNLRKHVATVSQFLNLSNNELDILADFLGHNINVHREFYRLPQATLQVCKISRLLLSMEQGNPNIFRGKSLDEIVPDDADFKPDEAPQLERIQQDDPPVTMAENSAKPYSPVPFKVRKPKQHKKWSDEEETALRRCLHKNYTYMKVPQKDECLQAIEQEPSLRGRSWRIVKDHVRNWLVKNCKKN